MVMLEYEWMHCFFNKQPRYSLHLGRTTSHSFSFALAAVLVGFSSPVVNFDVVNPSTLVSTTKCHRQSSAASMTFDLHEQPQRSASLLGLPSSLRHRIYLHTGVAGRDGNPCTYYLDGSRTRSFGDDPPPANNFAGLLLSCRTIYHETAALLYSANRFVIFVSSHVWSWAPHRGSLAPLHALSPTAVASLTNLKIVLSESSCHRRVGSRSSPNYCCRDGHEDEPWTPRGICANMHGAWHRPPWFHPTMGVEQSSAEEAVQAMLGEWHDAAAYLSSFLGVGRLELSLVCDIAPAHQYALEAARLAIAPLGLFPQLQDCHIRLSDSSDPSLQRLAEGSVLQACGSTPPRYLEPATTTTLALTSLPTELRLRILEYTDLITPWKEVTWSRQERKYQICLPPCLLFEDRECPVDIHYGCRLSRCQLGGSYSFPDFAPSPGCFCRRKHAAFSSTCRCWAPPTNLFLICRLLSRDAEIVFFTGNRFIIHDHHAKWPSDLPAIQFERPIPDSATPATTVTSPDYYPYDRYAASEFLRDVVPARCLAHLRFLELVFPPYVPDGWPRMEHQHPAAHDWRDTGKWMRSKINAPALTIRVVMADFSWTDSSTRASLTWGQGKVILSGYMNILRPLRRLVQGDDGLAGIYLQAAFPWRWTENSKGLIEKHGAQWLVNQEKGVSDEGLRHVYGPDANLDSLPRRGPEPRQSIWRRWYEVMEQGEE